MVAVRNFIPLVGICDPRCGNPALTGLGIYLEIGWHPKWTTKWPDKCPNNAAQRGQLVWTTKWPTKWTIKWPTKWKCVRVGQCWAHLNRK